MKPDRLSPGGRYYWVPMSRECREHLEDASRIYGLTPARVAATILENWWMLQIPLRLPGVHALEGWKEAARAKACAKPLPEVVAIDAPPY